MSDDLLGPCCICGGEDDVHTIVMLDRKAPVDGTGWGCAQCGLPADGAVAVVCDECAGRPLVEICFGYPRLGARIGINAYPVDPFDHDKSKHPEANDPA